MSTKLKVEALTALDMASNDWSELQESKKLAESLRDEAVGKINVMSQEIEALHIEINGMRETLLQQSLLKEATVEAIKTDESQLTMISVDTISTETESNPS